MHRFVREKGPEERVEKPRKHKLAIENGEIARETYENIILLPSTSSTTVNNNLVKIKRERKHRTVRKKVVKPFNENQLFRAATNGDVASIEQMCLNNRNVNETDRFGWTALMMAAYEGHLDVIKTLVRVGARINIESYKGDTAIGLAERGKHEQVVKFLRQTLAPSEPICLSSDEDDTNHETATDGSAKTKAQTFFCDICQTLILESDRKSHTASTLHRFNRTDSQAKTRHFTIPESNVGFQMLVQQGWDQESGLGANQNGVMYPIKTTLRKPRSGLGVRQPAKPKVTHFKPHDKNAIKLNVPPPLRIVKTKRQLRIEQLRTQRKDRYLRKLLS